MKNSFTENAKIQYNASRCLRKNNYMNTINSKKLRRSHSKKEEIESLAFDNRIIKSKLRMSDLTRVRAPKKFTVYHKQTKKIEDLSKAEKQRYFFRRPKIFYSRVFQKKLSVSDGDQDPMSWNLDFGSIPLERSEVVKVRFSKVFNKKR